MERGLGEGTPYDAALPTSGGSTARRPGARTSTLDSRNVTAVQPGDAVVHRMARGQHQDRGPHAIRSKLAADAKAVELGQLHVQDDDVVGANPDIVQRVRTIL